MTGARVEIAGRTLSLSNLDKVLWPETGFTKGDLIDYYSAISEVMLPHVESRPLTLRRFPNGVDAGSFYEKNCPSHRPDWMETVEMGGVGYCLANEPAALVWMANLASIELHPSLARASALDQPTSLVLDLDPGEGADVLACAEVALLLRDALERIGLESWVKTSGSKGLQMYVPLNSGASYEVVKPFANALAVSAEVSYPDTVVSTQKRQRRRNKVLIDWSQNSASKTTVSVYSVRARAQPTVSCPVTWDEVEEARGKGDAGALRFLPHQVLSRVTAMGDLMAPNLTVTQELPTLKT